jgi:hypothetical protein
MIIQDYAPGGWIGLSSIVARAVKPKMHDPPRTNDQDADAA